MTKIRFNYLKSAPEFRARTAFKTFLVELAQSENQAIADVQVIICSDEYLLELNRQHLNHDYYTDILTFQMNESGQSISGEMYISIDRVRENARQRKMMSSQELHRVMIHGLLHLCEYKDKLKDDQVVMRSKEDFYLERYYSKCST